MHTHCEEFFLQKNKWKNKFERKESLGDKNERNEEKDSCTGIHNSNRRIHKFQSVVLFSNALSLKFLSFSFSSFFLFSFSFCISTFSHLRFVRSYFVWVDLPLIIQHSTGLYILNKCVHSIFFFLLFLHFVPLQLHCCRNSLVSFFSQLYDYLRFNRNNGNCTMVIRGTNLSTCDVFCEWFSSCARHKVQHILFL